MDVKLDKTTMKALSNDTRIDILKELRRRRYTQSELAQELELSVPTVKEHLTALEKAGLVEMHDEGRKWKYYSLTKKAKHILEPESVNIFIVLSTFILSIVGGFYAYFAKLSGEVVEAGVRAAPEAEVFGAKAMAADMVQTSEAVASPVQAVAELSFFQQYGVWLFAIAAFISLVLLVFFICRRRRYLGKFLSKK